MDNSFLTVPSNKYKKSFEEYVAAYKSANDSYYFNKYKKGRRYLTE